MSDFVTITHPETGGTAEVPESSVSIYASLGWEVDGAPPPPQPADPGLPADPNPEATASPDKEA